MPRRFPIFQLPNAPLIVAVLARAVARLGGAPTNATEPGRQYRASAQLVSRLSLLVWAIEEVASGANWFRRLLGLAGGSYALSRLVPPGAARKHGRASGQ